jgi:glycosyltransferase involved in cell wall biosynthesis
MKIILIGPAYPLRGGLAAFNERLATAFMERGDEVELVTFSLQYPSILFPGKTQYSQDPAPEHLNINVSINSVNPLNWLSVGKALARKKADLVICRFWLPFMGPCLGTILRQIKKNGYSKVVSIIDNIVPHEKRIGDTVFARYYVQPVDAFVVMSRSVERELQPFLRPDQMVRYLPHPIYDSYGARMDKAAACAHLQLPTEPRYLLYFGFIRAYKGLDVLLEALADPRIRQLPLQLIVAGEYYASPDLYETIIQEKALQEQLVLRTEFIPEQDVAAYFGAADLVVQPYKTATQSGITQLAYHFEVPMLVTAVGGLPEVVAHEEAGYVVPPNDPKAVADAIVNFYEEKRETAFRKGVRARKAEFSWTNFLTGITTL